MDLSLRVPSVATAPRSSCSCLMRPPQCVSRPPGLQNVCWKEEPRSSSKKPQNVSPSVHRTGCGAEGKTLLTKGPSNSLVGICDDKPLATLIQQDYILTSHP